MYGSWANSILSGLGLIRDLYIALVIVVVVVVTSNIASTLHLHMFYTE